MQKLCKEIDTTRCFSVCTIGSHLPLKSKTTPTLKSFVVYKYICAGFGASYIGQKIHKISFPSVFFVKYIIAMY